MTKREFLDTLRRSLNGKMTEAEVADNIAYYENYISQSVSGGKSEEQVLSELGDPRLIAKTILQVDEQKDEQGNDGYYTYQEEVYTENPDGSSEMGRGAYTQEELYKEQKKQIRAWKIKGGLILVLVLAVVFLLLGTIFTILWKLLPFLIVLWVVLWIFRKYFGGY